MYRSIAFAVVISLSGVAAVAAQTAAPRARAVPPAARRVAAVPAASLTQRGPDAAPITIVEFSDFECPYCAALAPNLERLVSDYPDSIRIIFKHNPLSIHRNSALAHEAALAAGVQGKFWEMHDLLFANQQHLTKFDLIGYARRLNLDVPEFTAALTDRRFKPIVDQDLIEGRGFGVEATPTFFVNGRRQVGTSSYETLKEMVAALLDKSDVPAARAEETLVARIDEAGAPVRGPADAPVTIVEYSDLQCPFCANVVPTVRLLLAAYPDKIRWVFKNYPLDIHSNAMIAHRAALAAAEQGQFWPMHDALFANQQAVGRDQLIATARRLDLDVERFTKDLDNPALKAKIDSDLKEGNGLGVSGTPTFYINGKRLVGARPLADFKAAIDEALGTPPSAADAASAPAPPTASAAPANLVAAKADPGPVLDRGADNAPITLTWFSDFRSSLTPKAAALVQQVLDAYPGRVHVVVKNRPLETRPESKLAHEAAIAAAAQGKFWPMHDAIVSEPGGILDRDTLVTLAKRVGLDQKQFVADLEGGTYRSNVDRDLDDARRRDVRGTPVFFVNGQRIDGIQPLDFIRRIVDEALQKVPNQ